MEVGIIVDFLASFGWEAMGKSWPSRRVLFSLGKNKVATTTSMDVPSPTAINVNVSEMVDTMTAVSFTIVAATITC